ncbi:uncharacterized protein LOC122089842 [Macadamia integrifolia]|uniref:uncharacterized protein LOC122089842 n=1 Tax=Macadamia integrifolia TaxID=60698 RepID=UPI001C4EAA34|nr:uncharacterized protein LOC122089842 [Macadamia integrifolia]XP_042515491.1 uncharacterized protein LOC122089842 [Macadamia integrifolia]XP_042515492.1 uncharacterized protein LOC122089842 [Macadamia integrifolia]
METTTAQPEMEGSSDELKVVVTEPTVVQHVTKASSDQLLRKFAASDDEECPAKREPRVPKRRRRSRRNGNEDKENCESPSKNSNNSSLAERRSLLPPGVTRKATLLRQLGIARSQHRARDMIRNKSLMRAIEKTWRKTVEDASKVFIERHYNRHNRLINDAV